MVFRWQFSAVLWKLHFACAEEHFALKLSFSRKISHFFVFSAFWAKNRRTLGKHYHWGCQKLDSTPPEEHFEGKCFFENFIFFFQHFGLSKKLFEQSRIFFDLLATNFRQGFQKCILPVQRDISRKTIFKKQKICTFSESLSDVERKIFSFLPRFSGGFNKCAFFVTGGTV